MKTTINLEKKLLSSKQVSINQMISEEQQQESLLKHAQNILDLQNSDDLQKLRNAGFDLAVDQAFKQKGELDKSKTKREKMQDKRIFTLTEIKQVALTYDLRFLSNKLYKGVIPDDLPLKIVEAESLLKDQIEYEHYSYEGNIRKGKYFILAPKESFKLEVRPVDPLLFIKLTDGTFYLVHKWGNDLSIFRNTNLTALMGFSIFGFSIAILFIFGISSWWLTLTIPLGAFFGGIAGASDVNENNWNSKFED